ncbi:MAG: mechanosensitive ion channel family protein [Pleurocapsa minor GSE-CHR-MK-17-07R]|jgi:MscS family membrane protein|nr:mechanosensitive ion channel family protein [Pleurocapsa minor GSE-CHR-MK 17-07R]
MLDFIPQPVRDILVRVLLIIAAYLVLRLVQKLIDRSLDLLTVRVLRRLNRPDLETAVDKIFAGPLRILVWAGMSVVAGLILFDDLSLRLVTARIAQCIAIIAVGLAIYRLIAFLFIDSARLKSIANLRIEPALLPFFRTGLQLVTVILGALIVLQTWGFEITSLTVGLGIGSLAVSLAAQDTLSNLFAFVAIVGDRPFVVGDYIVTPDVEGTVEMVGLRSTRIRQFDQSFVTVPNNKLANAAVVNTTQLSKRVVDVTLGIPYGTPAAHISNMLNDIRARLAADADVEKETATVNMRRMGAQSMEVMIRFYILTRDFKKFLGIQERILFDMMQIFERSGVTVNRPGGAPPAPAAPAAIPGPNTPAIPPPTPPKPDEPDRNVGGLLGRRGGS